MRTSALLCAALSGGSVSAAAPPACTAAMLQQYSTAATEYSDCIKNTGSASTNADFCACVDTHVTLLASLPPSCTEAHAVKDSTVASTAALCPKISAARRLAEDNSTTTPATTTLAPAADTPAATTGGSQGSAAVPAADVVPAVGNSAAAGTAAAPSTAAPKYTHGAPTCISACFIHYAFDKQLPRGMEPQCDLWSDYLFGSMCSAPSLRHTCGAAAPSMLDDVLIKCIDTGCNPTSCMGYANATKDAMAAMLAKPAAAASCNKIFYAAEAQRCRGDESACAALVAAGKSDHQMLRSAFCGSGSCAKYGDCIKHALVGSQCSDSSLADGYSTFASTQKAVCDGLPEVVPCRNGCKDTFLADLATASKLAGDGTPTPAQTCDYYRDYVFGSHCAASPLKTWNVPAVDYQPSTSTNSTAAHTDAVDPSALDEQGAVVQPGAATSGGN